MMKKLSDTDSVLKGFVCQHCGERFQTFQDLDEHQWNNKHCPQEKESD